MHRLFVYLRRTRLICRVKRQQATKYGEPDAEINPEGTGDTTC